MVILEAFAIAASLLSFILALLHLWIGFPYERLKRKTQVIVFLSLAILIGSLTTYLGSTYKKNLHSTLKQSGLIERTGLHEVYYPVPYCSKPYIKINEVLVAGGMTVSIGIGSTADGESPFKLIEQGKDGFKLEFIKKEIAEKYKEYRIGVNWKAVGKIAGCKD